MVKPPHSPVVRSNLADGDIQPSVAGMAEKKPINRQPTMFTVNVPSGNGVATRAVIAFDTMYRKPPPSPEPINTSKNSFIVFESIDVF